MIRPDGADTAWVHVVDARQRRTRWRPACASRRAGAPSGSGSVRDIECWVPLTDGEQPQPAPPRADVADDEGPVTGIISPFRLEYEVAAGEAATRYLVGLGEGKIIGARAPSSDEVYAGSRGTDPKTGEPTSVEVEVGDTRHDQHVLRRQHPRPVGARAAGAVRVGADPARRRRTTRSSASSAASKPTRCAWACA